MRTFLSFFLVATIVVASPVSAQRGGPSAPPGVVVGVAQVEPFSDSYRGLGTARANESIFLAFQVAGTVEQIAFEEGQRVEEGQLLATLEAAEERAQVALEQASVDEQERELERARRLVASKAVPSSQVDDRESLLAEAEARLRAAQARLAQHTLRAPFSGIIGVREVSVGAYLSPGTSIATLDDIDTIKLDFEVPETYLGSLDLNLSVKATSAGLPGRTFEGRVTLVGTRVDRATRAISTRALIDNSEGRLKAGMLMNVELELSTRMAVLVPEEALVPFGSRQYVFLVGEDNVAKRIEVEIGDRRPGIVEITQGLSQGDRVIIDGTTKVQPGSEVSIMRVEESLGRQNPEQPQ